MERNRLETAAIAALIFLSGFGIGQLNVTHTVAERANNILDQEADGFNTIEGNQDAIIRLLKDRTKCPDAAAVAKHLKPPKKIELPKL